MSGKPIINLVLSENDASLHYFHEYGHSLNIDACKQNLEKHSVETKKFILANMGKCFDIPYDLIEHNTPRYVVDKIEYAVKKKE